MISGDSWYWGRAGLGRRARSVRVTGPEVQRLRRETRLFDGFAAIRTGAQRSLAIEAPSPSSFRKPRCQRTSLSPSGQGLRSDVGFERGDERSRRTGGDG